MRAQAKRLADILGVTVDVDTSVGEAVWVYAAPSHDRFGETVTPEALSGGRSILKGSAGLLEEDSHSELWVFVERVTPSDRLAWVNAKRTGAGRDPRLNEAAGVQSG